MSVGNLINRLFHPYSYLGMVIFTFLLAFIPNKVGWSSLYFVDLFDDLSILIAYIIAFWLGCVTYKLFADNARTGQSKVRYSIKDRTIDNLQAQKYLTVLFAFSFLMFLLRFYKAGGIPLFSGHLRHSQALINMGGFFVYPVMAMQVLGILSFILYRKTLKSFYLTFFATSILLFFLFGERTSVLIICLVSYLYYISDTKLSYRFFYQLMVVVAVVIVSISAMQVLRYGGAESLNRHSVGMNPIEFYFWIIHGDLTGAIKFGSYVNNLLGDTRLEGNYSFGIFKSVVIPGYNEHGASYLRDMFTGSASAQSVASIYGLYIDFGNWFFPIVFLLGVISMLLYQKFVFDRRVFWYVLYVLYFFQLLTSIRSGAIPVRPMFLYYVLVMVFILGYSTRDRLISYFVVNLKGIFLFSLGVSLLATVARV